MLRGPQTPGELKQRTERLHRFAELAAVEATLERAGRARLVARLPRRPGQKEERYAQLLGGEEAGHQTGDEARARRPADASPADRAVARTSDPPAARGRLARRQDPPAAAPDPQPGHRIAQLEREVAELRAELARCATS